MRRTQYSTYFRPVRLAGDIGGHHALPRITSIAGPLTVGDNMTISGGLHVGDLASPTYATGRVEVSGSNGEFSLQDRQDSTWDSNKRWLLYNNNEVLRFYKNGTDYVTFDTGGITLARTASNSSLALYNTNSIGLGPDIQIFLSGILACESSLYINIDSDNDSGGADFIIGKDADTSSATTLARFNENGNLYLDATGGSTRHNVNNATQAGVYFGNDGYTKYSAAIATVGTSNFARKGLAFYTGDDSDTTTNAQERMRIASGGEVSINTTSTPSQLNVNGDIALVDGMTAPAATSGWAKLYVDSSDGDLKIKFGDGTTKTIATD